MSPGLDRVEDSRGGSSPFGVPCNLHGAPVILGAGRPLFGELGHRLHLEQTGQSTSPYATHLCSRVVRS